VAGTGLFTIRNSDGTDIRSIAATDASQVTISGGQVTINPLSNLQDGKDYTVTIDNKFLKDLGGNAFAGITDNTTFNFKTAAVAAATTAGANVMGTSGKDNLAGTNLNDVFKGGKGDDMLSGRLGSDKFVYVAGDTSNGTKSTELIFDFATGAKGVGDVIDYSAFLTVGGSASAATATQASINQVTGMATFAAGSGQSVLDAITDIALRFTAAGNAAGEFALFKTPTFTGTYLFISDGQAGVTAGDVVVGLCGVSQVKSIDLTNGDLTITG